MPLVVWEWLPAPAPIPIIDRKPIETDDEFAGRVRAEAIAANPGARTYLAFLFED